MKIKRPGGLGGNSRPRRSVSNQYVTRSGRVIKIHRSLGQRWAVHKATKSQRKAERLRGLPKSRIKRIIWKLHPKRLAQFWFSRDGAILALKITGIAILAGFILMLGVFAYFRKDLPDLRDISGSNIGGSIEYYDKTGKVLLWQDYGAVKRIPLKTEEIPQNIRDATVAIEDRDFYNHSGFDLKGIFRAALHNIFGIGGGNGTQGGSTITQQLVKLSQDWTLDRSYTRKIKELILAVELERSYTKKEILTGYLNLAPYGGIEYGVQAASEDYFHKPAKDLTLSEAAMLAAIPQSPRYLSPYSPDFDKQYFLERQHRVLDIMVSNGYITKAQRDEAKKVDVLATVQARPANKYEGIKAPYFVLAAKNELMEKYVPTSASGSAKIGGWKVTTTLDLDLQKIAEDQVKKGMVQVRNQGGDSAAFVAEEVATGQVVSLVGGADFNNKEFGQNNYAQLPASPGSSFKPYDYAALIETKNNFGAGSVLFDTQGPLEGYPCTNKARKGGNCMYDYDFRHPGPVTIRYALGGSRNIPAVKAMLIAGIDKTISTAESMGLKSGYKCYEPGVVDFIKQNETQCYASSAIGDGAYLRLDEHVNGFSTISRGGTFLPRTYLLKIEDARDKVIDQWKPPKGVQAIRPDTAFILSDMLSDPKASYFSAGLKVNRYKGWNFGMKTGTTQDAKDAWMMGFSTKYAVGVWTGYHNRHRSMSGFMESMTRPIWNGWMTAAHDRAGTPVNWTQPASVQTLPAFVIRSHVGIGSVEPSRSTDFYPSWYKQKSIATSGKKQTIDKVSNKLATDCTPSRARQEVDNSAAASFSGDIFVSSTGVNLEQKDDVHKCDDVKPSLSSLTLNPDGSISVIAYQGTHPINSDQFKGTVNFIASGQVVKSFNISTNGQVVTLESGAVADGTEVSAEIIDSVLYDAQAPNSVTTEGETTINLNISPSSPPANNYQFTWNTISGAVSYQICIDTNLTPDFVCSNGNPGDSRVVSGSSRKAYILASNGTQSDTENFPP